jgi:hypothetical protein
MRRSLALSFGHSPVGARWIASRSYYFLPVRVLRVFRTKYCQLLRQAYARGALEFYGGLALFAEPSAFRRWLATAAVRTETPNVQGHEIFGVPAISIAAVPDAKEEHRTADVWKPTLRPSS